MLQDPDMSKMKKQILERGITFKRLMPYDFMPTDIQLFFSEKKTVRAERIRKQKHDKGECSRFPYCCDWYEREGKHIQLEVMPEIVCEDIPYDWS